MKKHNLNKSNLMIQTVETRAFTIQKSSAFVSTMCGYYKQKTCCTSANLTLICIAGFFLVQLIYTKLISKGIVLPMEPAPKTHTRTCRYGHTYLVYNNK